MCVAFEQSCIVGEVTLFNQKDPNAYINMSSLLTGLSMINLLIFS